MRAKAIPVVIALVACAALPARADSLEETVNTLIDANIVLTNKVLDLEKRVAKLEKAVKRIESAGKPTTPATRRERAAARTALSLPSQSGWYYLATFKRWENRRQKIKRAFERVERVAGTDVYYYIGPTKGYLVVVAKLSPEQYEKVRELGYSPLRMRVKELPEMFSIENL